MTHGYVKSRPVHSSIFLYKRVTPNKKDDLSWGSKNAFSLLVIALLNILKNSNNCAKRKTIFVGIIFLSGFFFNLEKNHMK